MVSTIVRFVETRNFLIGSVILFLILRLGLLLLVPVEQFSDAAWYLNRAQGIASGEGYSEGGHPTAFWPVGYPGMLAILLYFFGNSALVGQLANLVFATASLLLAHNIATRLFRNDFSANLAVLLFAIYPNNIAYTPLLFTEVYITFLLLLGFYLFVVKRTWPWTLLLGLIFGLAALTKPQMVFVPGLLVLLEMIFCRRERGLGTFRQLFIKGMVIYAVMAACLIPWAVRNTLVFDKVVLISTNSGFTLLTGNNPSANGGYVADDPLVKQRHFSVADQVVADKRAKALAMEWISNNPDRFFALIPQKFWRLWIKDGEGEWAWQAGYKHYEEYRLIFRSVRVLNQLYYIALLTLFATSLYWLGKRRKEIGWPHVLFIYVFVIYLTLISIVFSGQPRFHFPAMPWIIIYAAWAIHQITLVSALSRHQDSMKPAC
jgi:4-amino-4-deoxy-L-arabinose transferase-like glycosyltransferase